MQEMAAERRGRRTGRALTHTAEGNAFPHYSQDGRELEWIQYDGYSLATVRAIPVGGDQSVARDVVQIDAMGPFWPLADGSLVYEQGRTFRRDYSFEDLFRWDAKTGRYTRLTLGRRARDPAVSPDERKVAFSQNGVSESVLAVMDLVPDAPSSIVWRGQRFDQAYQPAWSPDGTRIAFSAWRNDGYRDILVVEVSSGKVTEVTHDRAIDMSPAWAPDGNTLFFDSDRTGISNIYAYDFADRTTWQVTNVFGGAFHVCVSPDGKRLAFESAAAAGGYDLYELPVDRNTWLAAHDFIDDKPPPLDIRDDDAPVSPPRAYRALESLAPQAWTAQLQLGDSPSTSIQTAGSDAVGLHSYSLAVGVDLDDGTTSVGAAYAYSGLRPNVRVSGARSYVTRGGLKIDGVSQTFHEEDWAGTLAVGIPFESRPSSSWSLSFDYDFDYFRQADHTVLMADPNQRTPIVPITNYAQAGLGVRGGFSSVRSTTFGLGPYTGWDISASMRLDDPALGATYRNITFNYGFDAYQNLWSNTRMIALRLVGGFRDGDLVRPGGFVLGGVPPQDVAMSIVNNQRSGASGYLRGYPIRSLAGNQYHLLNFEYRQELWNIEHGIETLPIYFRRLHLGLLSDVATAYDGPFNFTNDVRASVGAALRLDAFFGYFVPGTFEIGYARGVMSQGINETWFLLTGSL
jgi:hypothetical protein